MANLANMYLKEMIKRECWDAMVVKGRAVTSFHLPLSVSNYPMRERTPEELAELKFVTNCRKIEMAEIEASKSILPSTSSARNSPLVGEFSLNIHQFVLTRPCKPQIS